MNYSNRTPIFTFVLCLIFLTSCTPEEKVTEVIYGDEAIANESQTENWFAYGRTHNERRFFPASDINADNVAGLKVDWYMDLPNDVGLVSTPLVIDGVLYFTGTMNIVRAVDAVTGELLWTYDPKVGDAVKGKRKIGWLHNRGLSYYEGKIFAATWDGRLVGIDANTGEEIWQTRTFDMERSLYITGAPKAFNGLVLIGNGGTENGPTRGWVTAYDADTGEEAWKFYMVPGNPADGFENEAMEMAAKTWTGEWWKHGGGGNAWHGFTYDPELDLIYIGTGNGAPWNQKIRSPEGGDNLFLCSVLALDATTGEYRWHYQTTPGESWDYNSNMDIVLADLTIEGKDVKALMHAPKNGFFYVINRETGKLISAEPFTETTWATHVDMATGRPVEVEGARYEDGSADVTPMAWGAHSWHAMSYNPMTGLVYLPVIHQAAKYSDDGVDIEGFQALEFLGGTGVSSLSPDKEPRDYPGSLLAWDPVKQEKVWEIPQDNSHGPGTLTTAGNLVFQGSPDGKLHAYDATTGDILWTYDLGLGIAAPPISYKIDGKQYISLLVGWGGGTAGIGGEAVAKLGWAYRAQQRRLVTFSLDGTQEMPKLADPVIPKPVDDPDFIVDAALSGLGSANYGRCSACHGSGMVSGGMAPDLRASAVPFSSEAFASVVRDGARVSMGMPQFPDLTDEQLEGLRHFIRDKSRKDLMAAEGNSGDEGVGAH
ncbi:PQQ-dependent dehydrogenase, methanol/ethanol family [Fulvivirga sedimenti]|uniref:PQQ-dependent dehydrogenase, methanol/ethanol family n=1 Tax=Fulvivirga sedimenti TaxID=2879465 RepID=A0A9X1HXW5_9BACT|nr:PQQ-dependent dehydrogenase, methanol/ethanol family [Fulvivirga sedimenti]MCA6078747.1 PQQ-dependent dehydrogenase, methanol/ethanol family [Fulvivirga sedimenti]